MTREELDADWNELLSQVAARGMRGLMWAEQEMYRLLAAERAFVDRAAQAKAIRWAADSAFPNGKEEAGNDWATVNALHCIALHRWADRIERGEVEIP